MKKVLSILLAAVMVVSMFAGLQVTSAALNASGKCGPNVTYSFDSVSGQLTISGTGYMEDYDYDPAEGIYSHSIFYNESGIKSVVINDGVKSVGRMAFESCTNLESVSVPRTLERIEDMAFTGCTALTKFSMPDSVTYLGDSVFSGCTSLRTCSLSESLEYLASDTFRDCSSLERIALPSSIRLIGSHAFRNCTSLTSVGLPTALNTIDYFAFAGCTGLTGIYIPASVSSISTFAFEGCDALSTIQVDSQNEVYDSRNDCNGIIRKSNNALIAACKTTVIPDTVEIIKEGAFFECKDLGAITIPDSVKVIEDNAFEKSGYYNNAANWQNGLLYMGTWLLAAKSGAYGTSVAVKNGTRGIAEAVFGRESWSGKSCPLTTVGIPLSMKYIDDSAFYKCNNIKNVYYTGSPAQWKRIDFTNSNEPLLEATMHYYHNASSLAYFRCAARTAQAQKVEWNKVSGASGYQVQISNAAGNKWATYYTVKGTSCVFKNLAAGTNYKFRVRFFKKAANGKVAYSAWTKTLNSPTLPRGTTITKLTGAKRSFVAQWKRCAVTGYQIQYATNAQFTGAKILTVKKATTYKALVSKLSANKVYYARIRTYKTIGGVNYFSTWSGVAKVKTK